MIDTARDMVCREDRQKFDEAIANGKGVIVIHNNDSKIENVTCLDVVFVRSIESAEAEWFVGPWKGVTLLNTNPPGDDEAVYKRGITV